MNLYLRLLRVLLANLIKPRLRYTEEVTSRFRVWPHDIDLFGHMNNGRYLQIMDVARAEWMTRTGVADAIRRNRWAPLLGGGFVKFRHSLHVLQTYQVRTRLMGWDQRWFFLEHAFLDKAGRCVAKGISRAALRAHGTWVPTREVALDVHPEATRSPELPAHVREWLDLEERMFQHGLAGARTESDFDGNLELSEAGQS